MLSLFRLFLVILLGLSHYQVRVFKIDRRSLRIKSLPGFLLLKSVSTVSLHVNVAVIKLKDEPTLLLGTSRPRCIHRAPNITTETKDDHKL